MHFIVTTAQNISSLSFPVNHNVDLSTPQFSSICSPACQPLNPTSCLSGVKVSVARLTPIGQQKN